MSESQEQLNLPRLGRLPRPVDTGQRHDGGRHQYHSVREQHHRGDGHYPGGAGLESPYPGPPLVSPMTIETGGRRARSAASPPHPRGNQYPACRFYSPTNAYRTGQGSQPDRKSAYPLIRDVYFKTVMCFKIAVESFGGVVCGRK